MKNTKGFTADLRRRLLDALNDKNHVSYRAAAQWTGLAPSTMHRFLEGRPIRSDSLDRIVEYVRKRRASQ